MHPALSVIAFTTLSGAGYGLWLWLGLALLVRGDLPTSMGLWGLGLGGVLVTAGLLASLAHLGHPERAWRALGQWRSSWLSREGVLALTSFAPALAAAGLLITGGEGIWLRVAGAALALLSLATVASTAMIYASLKTVPAWSHPGTVLGYLAFAMYTGGLLAATGGAVAGLVPAFEAMLAGLIGALALLIQKHDAWRRADAPLPHGRDTALGLPAGSAVRGFERPHTGESFVTREMAFVLGRRHARRLRAIAAGLFAGVPALMALGLLAGLLPLLPALALATLSALVGSFVERWLFFAEARHVVVQYH